jgi:peptidyl-prolyl cis-trans isomerase A (cyclophilin A)
LFMSQVIADRRLAVFIVVAVLYCGILCLNSAAHAQQIPPWTKDQIIRMLKGDVSPKHVETLARERGVDFQVTPEVESELRQAGLARGDDPEALDGMVAILRGLAPTPDIEKLLVPATLNQKASDVFNAKFITTKGDFVVQVTRIWSPLGADRFYNLVKNKFFTDVIFYRVVPGFMVQFGINGNPKIAAAWRHATILDDPVVKSNKRGTLTFATHGTNSRSTQLFVNLGDNSGLDRLGNSPFGEVVEGMEVIDKLYSDYGEQAAMLQDQIESQGNDFLKTRFPNLDSIKSATILPGAPATQIGTFSTPTVGTVKEKLKDGLKYVWIPPGTFLMGCWLDNECIYQEKPIHRVTLTKGFWIGQTPVTVGAYKRFARSAGKAMPPEPNILGRALNSGWSDDAMPIVDVAWDEARDYCTWAGGRLPTETEWEYAARGGSTEPRYGPLDEVAWYADNSGRQRLDSAQILKDDSKNYGQRLKDNGNGMHEVAQKRPNGFGLFDTLGNVWEWVNDWFDGNYYQNSPSQDPSGPSSGTQRVLRGGSWGTDPRSVRVSFRVGSDPGVRGGAFGFRCVGEVVVP